MLVAGIGMIQKEAYRDTRENLIEIEAGSGESLVEAFGDTR